MPRKYVRKREDPPYTIDDIKKAVQAVLESKKTYREASAFYHVPTTVIFNRIKGRKTSIDKMGAGMSKVLKDNEEEYLVHCLKARASMGYPCNKEEMKCLIGEYLTKKGIQTRFKNNIPGDDWYQDFMKRNHELSLKKPELLQKARQDARKPYIVYEFYDTLKKEIIVNGLRNKPMYVFNTDESGFRSDPTRVRGIGEKGKALSRVSGGSGRESTSVLGCVSADGNFMPPLIIYKGAAVQARWTSENCIPGTTYAATANGWMEEPVFYNWFVTAFIPFVNKIRDERQEREQKVVLIFDGHKSHISVRIIDEAMKAKISLVRLPSHLTDRIQPLDVSVFGPVKTAWEKKLVDYGVQQMGTGCARLSKEKFGELLGEVLKISLTRQNIVSGFESTGIFPVNPEKFPRKYFDAEELKVYLKLKQSVDRSLEIVDTMVLNEPVVQMTVSFEQQSSSLTNVMAEGQLTGPEAIPSISKAVDYPDADTSNPKKSTETGISSPLINKIFKLITTDNTTNEAFKNRILAALSMPLENETSPYKDSPTKKNLESIFKVSGRTQEKKKVTIPRLKQSNYGEVLTTGEVVERLRVAQKEKEEKDLKRKVKKENKGKGKGTGKKSKLAEKAKPKPSRSDSDDDGLIQYAESDDSAYNLENEIPLEFLDPIKTTIKVGDFVLAIFKGGKRMATTYKYVCHVDEVDNTEREANVTSLKCVDNSKQLFSFNDLDISSVHFEDVVGILPEPEIEMKGERLYYKFKKAVDVYEKA